MKVNTIKYSDKCEVCHQQDKFHKTSGYCNRCEKYSEVDPEKALELKRILSIKEDLKLVRFIGGLIVLCIGILVLNMNIAYLFSQYWFNTIVGKPMNDRLAWIFILVSALEIAGIIIFSITEPSARHKFIKDKLYDIRLLWKAIWYKE